MILWGSAATPLGNPLFIPTRINEIRAALERLNLGGCALTLFGHGPNVPGNDTSYSVDGRTQFKRADLRADLGADAASLNQVLTGVLRADPRVRCSCKSATPAQPARRSGATA